MGGHGKRCSGQHLDHGGRNLKGRAHEIIAGAVLVNGRRQDGRSIGDAGDAWPGDGLWRGKEHEICSRQGIASRHRNAAHQHTTQRQNCRHCSFYLPHRRLPNARNGFVWSIRLCKNE